MRRERNATTTQSNNNETNIANNENIFSVCLEWTKNIMFVQIVLK